MLWSCHDAPSQQQMTPPRVALITGGAAGIGREIASTYLDQGIAVHVCDTSVDNIARFLAEHPTASATRADVSRPDEVDRVFADLSDQYGRLDILVNNAGVAGPTARVEDIADEDWDACVAIDLNGTFYVTRRAVPLLLRSDAAAIINIASTGGQFGYPLRSPYAASKWAQIGLTKTWAMELGPRGVRVNAVCPGSVDGPRIDKVIAKDAAERGVSADSVRDAYLKQTSMRTFVDASDIAQMALFLCGDGAAKISGQVIAVDGHTEGLSNSLGES